MVIADLNSNIYYLKYNIVSGYYENKIKIGTRKASSTLKISKDSSTICVYSTVSLDIYRYSTTT